MNSSKIIRKFERMLFKGIPEQPEPTWERHSNTNVSMRETGRAQSAAFVKDVIKDSQILGKISYNYETGEETFIPST